MCINYPLKLSSTRVWRTYLGGKILDEISGKDKGMDGYFPEVWIASIVLARNAGRENVLNEGLSALAEDSDVYLKSLIQENMKDLLGEEQTNLYNGAMGFLVKLIDSAERLTIQVHPDRKMAQELFESPYGKTECWHILGGRLIDGKKPCVYIGFKEGITKEYWEQLFRQQNVQGMLDCMHQFEVKTGDTILIEGGIPHAIGAGCFLTEIQEPTDYTIRVEKTTPSGLQVADLMCHQGLGFEKMFDCFHYNGVTREEAYNRWFIRPNILKAESGSSITSLIGYENTPYFKMNMLKIKNNMELNLPKKCSAMYVLKGEGTCITKDKILKLQQGDQFFIPAKTQRIILQSNISMEIIQYFGPELPSEKKEIHT